MNDHRIVDEERQLFQGAHAACNMALGALADVEAELREQLALREGELDAFRQIAHEAIHALARATQRLDAARRTNQHLRSRLHEGWAATAARMRRAS